MQIDGVQVFSATKARERDELADRVNDWLARSQLEVVEKVVVQSSDQAFHCLTIVIFYRGKSAPAMRSVPPKRSY